MTAVRKCLFVEGPPGCGKTTSILKSLGFRLREAGGFGTCRLLRADQSLYGFCQCDPKDLKTADLQYTPALRHIFLRAEDGIVDFAVFRNYSLKRLRDGLDAPFCLLDEIGGAELLIPEFEEALFSLLDSGAPVIGVWKNRRNSGEMAEALGLGEAYRRAYKNVRRKLMDDKNVMLTQIESGEDAPWRAALCEWRECFLGQTRN